MTAVALINTQLQLGAKMDLRQNRFNGFPQTEKPLKRLDYHPRFRTQLKPGVNNEQSRTA